jgi:hypothetical protein
MATYKHIRSSTANKRPTTSIADGQLALNTNATSPGLFFKDSTGATIIKIGPVHVGTTAPNATPGAGGSSGNSTGEVWLDTSITPVGVKIWNGSAWVNGTPTGSTTVQGLLELATDVETQSGSDAARAVTPAGLQSKVSDSISTTSSTTIASSTAVKAAYDLAAAGLPRSGGTVTGNLEIGTTGSLTFEGSVADGFETALAATNPTADRVITLPDISGTVVTTGDTGSVTSAMIANGTIVSGDIASGTIVDSNISASAAIAVSKLADGAAGQIIQTDSAGTGVEWSDTANLPLGSAAAPAYRFQGDNNTGIYSPGADQVAISTSGTERARIDSSGRLLVGTSSSSNVNIATFQGNSSLSTGTGIVNIALGNTSPGTTDQLGRLQFTDSGHNSAAEIVGQRDGGTWNTSTSRPTRLVFSTTADGASSPTERMRIPSTGDILFNKTATDDTSAGFAWRASNYFSAVRSGGASGYINRLTDDGALLEFAQDNVTEGTISVSGTTVTYGGGHIARWSQLPNTEDPSTLLKGTVMSNLDEMCEWGEEDNEQLNKTKVSNVEGDPNVAGVFVSTSFSEEGPLDFFVGMTGDMIIRIAEGVTVQRGDLLMSAGDGTAKPQDDDIIRSKTVAKVTSTHVTCTYDDGSYCVPCVLMAC